MGDYRSLRVWQLAYRVTLDVYGATTAFPREERFGLTSQIRRASTSVVANLAEGSGRATDPEFRHFVRIARGSNQELICELMLARDLEYLESIEVDSLLGRANEVGRMLTGLLRAGTTKRRSE